MIALWYMVPTLYSKLSFCRNCLSCFQDGDYALNGSIYVILEVLAIISYQLASFGTSKENMFFVKTYGIVLAILTAEVSE